jgi:hypothetical protein
MLRAGDGGDVMSARGYLPPPRLLPPVPSSPFENRARCCNSGLFPAMGVRSRSTSRVLGLQANWR